MATPSSVPLDANRANAGTVPGQPGRIDAAQDLVAADLGIAEVMQAGGWKTPTMVARYTEHLQARRGAMPRRAKAGVMR